MIEHGASWLPGWMRQLDSAHDAFRKNEERLQQPVAAAERVRAPPDPRDAVPARGRRLDRRATPAPRCACSRPTIPHVEGGRNPLRRFEASLAGQSLDVEAPLLLRQLRRLDGADAADMTRIARREFLRQGALLGASLGLQPLAASGAIPELPPRVRGRRTLGRTGLEISDIGFGSSRASSGDEALVRHALERGITYFDTAESYTGGDAEETLGRALEGPRPRWCSRPRPRLRPARRATTSWASLEGSLRRLRTDHVDVYFNHAVNDVASAAEPGVGGVRDARAKARGQDPLHRHVGSRRAAGRVPRLRDRPRASPTWCWSDTTSARIPRSAALHDGHGFRGGAGGSAARAAQGAREGRGRGGDEDAARREAERHEAVRAAARTFAQAAFRWVLDEPERRRAGRHHERPGAGRRVPRRVRPAGPTRADLRLLERYESRNGHEQCRYGCNECANACPLGVPISDVLRTRMYAEDYGDLALARRELAQLESDASACLSCAHQACAGSCPHGLDIPGADAARAARDRRLSGPRRR